MEMTKVRMVVEWESAGHPHQDEALVDEIADKAMELLDGYDPFVEVEVQGARTMGEATDDLLLEWYRWWQVAGPSKMPRALHVRTALTLFEIGRVGEDGAALPPARTDHE